VSGKISAQESRRKKKEYMDALERKVEVLTGENTDYKKKIESLEESNASLLSQLQKLQALVARSSTASTTGTSNRIVRHTDTTAFTSVSSREIALKFFFFMNPLLFASCTNTFSKWCKITRGMKRSAQ
jgi:cyclic AMP-responsive element-binding protein 3